MMCMEKFKHVRPTKKYEKQAIEYINEFYEYNSNINGVSGLYRFLDNYDGWLLKLEEDRNRIPSEEKVPTETFFLIRENDDRIVGMINIRLTLNERLHKFGGHIGYSIRPTERRKGYNKINLYLGLLFCEDNDINEVLMDCDKDNLASARTMIDLGGELLRESYDPLIAEEVVQYYKIDVRKSINDNRSIYERFISCDERKLVKNL